MKSIQDKIETLTPRLDHMVPDERTSDAKKSEANK